MARLGEMPEVFEIYLRSTGAGSYLPWILLTFWIPLNPLESGSSNNGLSTPRASDTASE